MRRRGEWNRERTTLIHIVKQLQWTVQRSRGDAAHALSVDQLARFKEELRDLKARETRLAKALEQVSLLWRHVPVRAPKGGGRIAGCQG